MSMIANYIRISPEELAELQADPDTTGTFLESLLEELYPDAEGDDNRTYAVRPVRHLDIDKAWHGIHFLLNGNPWEGEPPLFNVVLGGTELGDEEIGYGPARYLTPEEVREAHKALEQISVDDLRARYDARTLTKADIYPEIIWERDGDEALQYLLDYYVLVVEFFREAAKHGDAMLLYMD